jgi:hypothetical protein
MSDKLIDQEWFIKDVNPTSLELQYLNQNYEEVVRRTGIETAKGVDAQVAVVKVCREMLGK